MLLKLVADKISEMVYLRAVKMYSEEGGKKAQCILAKDGSCLISFFFFYQ